ncbi:DHA2 family efflux MFS transporter permease subunit [Bifidobacterium coryneforme]|uniref:DHA2 family efflux MFS transporter permease subunit n=2 Tax=Bifidobacterium coryneforme TaxID=1687 RepID=UPI0004E5E9E6|nr:DHA2 family efflux MFS transporter permease subunit [Bifidobacterium coryneforme]AII74233.1 drug resistance MFS transporter [Bifidobacterium coryneforme]
MGKVGSKGGSEGNRSVMMGTLLAGAFIALMAETFLNNALPTIMADFRVSQSTAQWLSTSYLLVVGLMIPVSAWVFSNFQSKHAFIVMMATFLMGSLVCTFSGGHFALLLTGRIIQAVAAGSLMPFIQNVVLLLFPPEKRGVALGVVGLVVALGPTVGPTLSGFVLEHWSWKALFVLLAIMSAAILVVSFFLVYTVNDRVKTRLDVASVIYSCLGFGLLLYALSSIGDKGGASVPDLGLFLIGLLVVVVFCWRQLHLEYPLVNLRVFTNATFNLTSLLSTLSNIAMVGVELVLPLYLQNTRGSSALTSGLVMLPGAIVMGIFNPLSGMIYQRIGARRISLLGYMVLLVGTLPMIWFGTATSLIVIACCYALRLAGVALVMMTTFTEGINALPPDLAAHGNAAASTVRQVGGSLGTAAAMMIVTIGVERGRHGGAMSAQAFEQGYRWAFVFLAIVAVVGLGASFFLKSRTSEAR